MNNNMNPNYQSPQSYVLEELCSRALCNTSPYGQNENYQQENFNW